MSHGPRRIINFCLALVFAVMSVNLSGVLSLQTAHAENKGTIKVGSIDLADDDDSTANQPHIDGCSLEVRFFGYKEGSHSGTVVFESKAPTENQLTSVSGNTSVSFTSMSNQGSVENHVESYTLAFTGEPQAQQGYHVKVTVQIQGEGKKSKVFWIQGCTAPTQPTHVTAIKPVVNPADKCGVEDNTYSIVPVTGVVYKVNDQVVSGDAISAGSAQSITVKAYPVDSTYTLDGTTEWTLTFNSANCPVDPETPTIITEVAVPQFIDDCMADKDVVIIPDTEGITYLLNDDESVAGTYHVQGTAHVMAIANEGYTIAEGVRHEWTQAYLTDNSCTPGMGGAGEGDPTSPATPVVVANTVKKLPVVSAPTVAELPQTGPSDGNALVKILSIFLSGAATYGALFFALNRRNLLGNK